MQATNVRNLLHLHSRQINLFRTAALFFNMLGLILVLSGSLHAQIRQGSNLNYMDFQYKPYYFGITLGFNSSNYNIQHSKTFIRNDSFAQALGVRGPGFNLGIVSNLKIGEYFDLRFLPTLSFVERSLNYTAPESGAILRKPIESVLVEMPFHVRYKSATYHDFRLFVIGGVKYTYDVARRQVWFGLRLPIFRRNTEPGYSFFSPSSSFRQRSKSHKGLTIS
jgi:hypothetical protein